MLGFPLGSNQMELWWAEASSKFSVSNLCTHLIRDNERGTSLSLLPAACFGKVEQSESLRDGPVLMVHLCNLWRQPSEWLKAQILSSDQTSARPGSFTYDLCDLGQVTKLSKHFIL